MIAEKETEGLAFVFTEDSFHLDLTGGMELPESEEELRREFARNRYRALFLLGFSERRGDESPSLSFLRCFAEEYLRALTDIPELELVRERVRVAFTEEQMERLLCSVPFGLGTEYITGEWISRLCERLTAVFAEELEGYRGSVSMYLTEKSQNLRIPERVFFHLVESREEDFPFAFLATYATKDGEGRVRHMPLSYALTEYKNQRDRLMVLLSCLNKASEVSEIISSLVSSGEMFHPIRLTASEAFAFLKDAEKIEAVGIICRVPNWWKRKASDVSLQISLGEEQPAMLGFSSLISMKPRIMVDGVELTKEEIELLLQQTEGLASLKGKWVEIDHARLAGLLKEMEESKGELTLLEALRMETGLEVKESADVGPLISNGKWLGEFLQELRHPAKIRSMRKPVTVKAKLRPYQKTGYSWLTYMSKLGFGACLADDMGLGKTLQLLTFLEGYRREKPLARILLIVPASLVGNWKKEAEKFAPSMPVQILHGRPAAALEEMLREPCFLNITTYGMAIRMKRLQEIFFDCLILDEAQAIKNPGTKQTRTVKKLKAGQRIALTGTPIENDLGNLWSLFDFLNKGLLGSSDEFQEFTKRLSRHSEGYQKLKSMVSPFILRRLKTDKSVISDLPDKIERNVYVELSKKQIVLYRKQIEDLEKRIEEAEGLQRRGIVLAAITKLKQICNHPDQFMGQEAFDPEESGKFRILREICSTIYEKRERVLIFTQYKEVIAPLSDFLNGIFRKKGLCIHGGTPVKKRQELVEQFNAEEYVPYMILSLKAGGTGLNLTAANHVIHFDRWWNPAVENQATDRAYRIGQSQNVVVHKLISQGTIEEKIDAMINSKKELAENVIGSGGENWITEMDNESLMRVLRLEL